MKKFVKVIGTVSLVSMMAVGLYGCSSDEDTTEVTDTADSTDADAEDADVDAEDTDTDEEAAASDETLYIYNSKGENATQFEEMGEAYSELTGVDVKTYSIGSGQDHMATLRTEMMSDDMPTIFSIQGLKELPEWQISGYALDLNTVDDNPEFQDLVADIDEDLWLTDDNVSNYGVPYNVEGYGYIVDRQMLMDLFGYDDAGVDALLEDIKAASYEEWDKFIVDLDDYIQTGTSGVTTLNGNTHSFASEKQGLANELNGVFAVMGAEKWTYGDHLVNVALNAAFDSPAAAYNATTEEIEALYDPLLVYAEAMDTQTSYLAGKDGPDVRSDAFISSTNTGYDQIVQIFADSKGVFLQQGNWAYGNIEDVNADMAERLTFIPIKMPMTEEDITVEDRTVEEFNSSIPVYVPNFYAINAKATEEEQQTAMDFLVWLNTDEEGQKWVVDEFDFIPYNADPDTTVVPNSLGNSIISYMESGMTLQAPYHGAPATWAGETLGLYVMENYMNEETWTQNGYEAIANEGVNSWLELLEY